MLKTLHIETGRHLYGGALQVAFLVRGLQSRGHRAAVICPTGSGLAHELAGQAPVFQTPFRGELDPTFVLRVSSIIKREKPDVVHLHSRRGADTLGGLAARLCRGPLVVLSRRVDDPVSSNFLNNLRYGFLCDNIIAISEGIRTVLVKAGVPAEKVRMVHSAIDVARYEQQRDRTWFADEFGVPEGAPALGVVAQLIERKGHGFLLQAMPSILERFPDCRLLFFGKGPRQAELEALAYELDLSGRLVFAGFRNDMPRVLPNLDVLVHPASAEGLGVSLLQAACAGVPIVACAAGGIPEIVVDGRTGWLVPSCDPDKLGEAILQALADRELASQLAVNARHYVEAAFGLDQMVDGNLQVYLDGLGLKG